MKIGYPKGDNYKLVVASLQPCQRTFIECLTTCSDEELLVNLQAFTQWVWEKSDVVCWASVLNRFDDIFFHYINLSKDYINGLVDIELNEYCKEVELVKSALRTSIMIVENCGSKSSYNSVDLLASLLSDINLEIVYLSTRMLCVCFSIRNLRNSVFKEIPSVSERLSAFVTSPLPEPGLKVLSSNPTSFTRIFNNPKGNEFFVSCPLVLEYYLKSFQYWLSRDSVVELGSYGSDSPLEIPLLEVLNLELSQNKSVNYVSNEKLFSILNSFVSNTPENNLYFHMLKAFKAIINTHNVPENLHHMLRCKMFKVYSLYFVQLQRLLVNTRLSSLICILLINTSSYTQFLSHNPSFLLELSWFIKCHEHIDYSTMIVSTELLSAMIYDGIQYKALSNLLGFGVPHGIYVKVLKSYLHHAQESEPLPPVLRLKTPTNPNVHVDFVGKDEKELCALQAEGFVLDHNVDEVDWSALVSDFEGRNRIFHDEERMRVLLQLLVVYYSIINYHGNCGALTNLNVLESLVRFTRCRNPIYTPVIIYVVQVLEALLDYNQTVSRLLRSELHLYHLYISRLQYDMYKIERSLHFNAPSLHLNRWPEGWILPVSSDPLLLRVYWLSFSELSARKFLFKSIIKDIYLVTRPYSGRGEINDYDVFAASSPMVPIFLRILNNPLLYGLGVYSTVITLILDTIRDDPVSQEEMHKLGIIPAFLNSICEETLKSEESLNLVPTAISDLFLHRTAQDYYKNVKYEFVQRLVEVVVKREFVLFHMFGEVAASIGLTLCTIVKHHDTAHSLFIKRLVKVIYELLQEALTFPPFQPISPTVSNQQSEEYYNQFKTSSPPITLSTLSLLDVRRESDFYADRIANLGKCLSTFLSLKQSVSQFISCDGIKLLMQLCTVPCLPPMFLQIYPQHPLVLIIKYLTSQAATPSIIHFHTISQHYLRMNYTLSLDSIKTVYSVIQFVYLMHKENYNLYHGGCAGKHQLGVEPCKLSLCELHHTITLVLNLLCRTFPDMLKNVLGYTKSLTHEHPQLRAYKRYSVDNKDLSDMVFSANDLFWSSQCQYAYSNSSDPSPLTPDDYLMELCKSLMYMSKSLIYTLNISINEGVGMVNSGNECLKGYVYRHCNQIVSLFHTLLTTIPDINNGQLDVNKYYSFIKYSTDLLEFVYKLMVDDRTNGLYLLTTILFSNRGGMALLTKCFDNFFILFFSIVITLCIKLNGEMELQHLLGTKVDLNSFPNMFLYLSELNNFSIPDLKELYNLVVKSLQICLTFFSKCTNPKTVLNTQIDSNIIKMLNGKGPDENYVGNLFNSIISILLRTCWKWFEFLINLEPKTPASSTANPFFYIPNKITTLILKVHLYLLDYLSPSRQQALNLHFLNFGANNQVNLPTQAGSSTNSANVNMRRGRRRNRIVNTGESDFDNSHDFGNNIDSVRSYLSEMGFNERDINSAISHCGTSDITTLTDWLVNIADFAPENIDISTYSQTSHDDSVNQIVLLHLKSSQLLHLSQQQQNDQDDLDDNMDSMDEMRCVNLDGDSMFMNELFVKLKLVIIDYVVKLSKLMPTFLPTAYDLIFKLHSFKLKFMLNNGSSGEVEFNILNVMNKILLQITNVYRELVSISPSVKDENLQSLFSPVIFIDDGERQMALEYILEHNELEDVVYNYRFAHLHEKLLSLFYLLSHLMAGKENFTHLAHKIRDENNKPVNILQQVLDVVDFFLNLRTQCFTKGVISPGMMGMKKRFGLAIPVPEWCVSGENETWFTKRSSTTSFEYRMLRYGFYATKCIPQVTQPPPFFKYALICIHELVKTSIIDGFLSSNFHHYSRGLRVEGSSAGDRTRESPTRFYKDTLKHYRDYEIPDLLQEKILYGCMKVLELFPGSDPDVTFSLLSILCSLTEVYKNAEKLIRFKPLLNKSNDFVKILLAIPKSGSCVGALRMVSNILVHVMEDYSILNVSLKNKIINLLSPGPMNLNRFIDEIYPYNKKCPMLLFQVLESLCVIVVDEALSGLPEGSDGGDGRELNSKLSSRLMGSGNYDLKDLSIALKNCELIKDLVSTEGLVFNLLTPSDFKPDQKRCYHMTKTIVEFIHFSSNLHGLTNTLYPLTFNLSSFFFLFNVLNHNFPLPLLYPDILANFSSSPSSLKTTFPCKLEKLDRYNVKSLVTFITRNVFTMICSFPIPSTQDSNYASAEKLLVDSLENYSNALIIFSSHNPESCASVIEQVVEIISLFEHLEYTQMLTVALYILSNLLHNLFQLRFKRSCNIADCVTKLKKVLCAALNRVDLTRPESTLLSLSIVKLLVLVTNSSEPAANEVRDVEADGVEDGMIIDVECNESSESEDDDEVEDEEIEYSEDDYSEGEPEGEEDDMIIDVESNESEDIDDVEEEDVIDEDEEVALPHEVEEDYNSVQYSESVTTSSIEDLEDEEEDEGPRIRVAGEIDEVSRNENSQIIDTTTNISIPEENDSDYSATHSDTEQQQTNDQNHTIHIEIQFNNQNSLTLPTILNNAGNSRNTVFTSQEQVNNENTNTDTWSNPRDLDNLLKNPILPNFKKSFTIQSPDPLLHLLLNKLLIVKYKLTANEKESDNAVVQQDEQQNDDANPVEEDRQEDVVEQEVVQEDPVVQNDLVEENNNDNVMDIDSEGRYYNRGLEIIANALGITYLELFNLSNMDPGVIAELPTEMREEIISQQLNTINVEAVANLRNSRPRQAVNFDSVPSRVELQYLESLPRSLRLDVIRAIYGENSTEANEINTSLDLEGDHSSLLAALGPFFRGEGLGSVNDFLNNITSNFEVQERTVNIDENVHPLLFEAVRSRLDSHSENSGTDISRPIILPLQQDLNNRVEVVNRVDLSRTDIDRNGLTLGFIIGEVRGQNGLSRRLNQRPRDGFGRRVSGFNRRNDLMREVFLLSGRGMRMSRLNDSLNSVSISGHDQSEDERQNLDARILSSIPQILNTIDPSMLDLFPQRANTNETQEINEVNCDSMLEDIVKLFPKSPCSIALHDEQVYTLLNKGSSGDLDFNSLVAVCRLFYLPTEVNKRIFFKLLHNISATNSQVDLIKLLLYVVKESILNVQVEFECEDLDESFFRSFPPAVGVSLPSMQAKVQVGVETDKQSITQVFEPVGKTEYTNLSFLCSERVLEQMRSIFIALPATIASFSKTLSLLDSSSQEIKRKKKKTESANFYPIDFFFHATCTNLFQSSTKHMNHLLMLIHHLLFTNTPNMNDLDSELVSNLANYAKVDSDVHLEIINSLSENALLSFLTIFTSYKCQSTWLLSLNSKDVNATTQLDIIAQILSLLYKHRFSGFITQFLSTKFRHLMRLICEKLERVRMNDYQLEPLIFTLLRSSLLTFEMIKHVYQVDGNDDIEYLNVLDGMINELGGDWEELWKKLDECLAFFTRESLVKNFSGDFYKETHVENFAFFDLARSLIPLIELFFTTSQLQIAHEYSLPDLKFDKILSNLNYETEQVDRVDGGTMRLFHTIKSSYSLSRASQSTKDGVDEDEDVVIEISRNHLKLLNFIEGHKRLLNLFIKQTPSLLNNAFLPMIRLAPMCLSFDIKRQYFRQKLREGRMGLRLDPIKINVRRQHVFLDSYHQLRLKTSDEMKGKLTVSFGGEEGVDAGGLTREWYTILSKEIFNPNYALFTREGRKQEFNHPNPLSAINPDHLNYFKFIGRVIGKALYDGHHMDAYFCRSFYKHMLGTRITPSDAESVDPQFYNNLISIRNCSLEQMGLELYFSTEIDEFGKVKIIDLIPNGRNILVTDENKHKYIQLLCRHKVTNGIKDQLEAFMEGFRELISPELVSIFDDRELELLISGIPIIDLDNLRLNVEYVNYSETSPQIIWLWETLAEFDQSHLAAFLQFVTGTSRVPIGGFKNLMGMRGPQKISIHKTFGEDRLPTAHTCFNQLDLPCYPSREMLKSKLLQAILEGKEGFGFM